jgi:hypothetical protein
MSLCCMTINSPPPACLSTCRPYRTLLLTISWNVISKRILIISNCFKFIHLLISHISSSKPTDHVWLSVKTEPPLSQAANTALPKSHTIISKFLSWQTLWLPISIPCPHSYYLSMGPMFYLVGPKLPTLWVRINSVYSLTLMLVSISHLGIIHNQDFHVKLPLLFKYLISEAYDRLPG